MQEIFSKDLDEMIKNQIIMSNAMTEMKGTLERTSSRIIEAEERISEVEDRMVEINEAGGEKRIKRNEDSLRDLWYNAPTFKS